MKYFLLILVYANLAHAEVYSAETFPAAEVLESALASSDFPSLPDENSKRPIQPNAPDEFYQIVFDHLPILKAMGLRLVLSSQGNANMDSQRKVILFDPELAKFMLMKGDPREGSGLPMLYAHEGSHYILKLFKLRHPEAQFVDADEEHACVDLLALNILRRSGYSRNEVKTISEAYIFALEESYKALSQGLKLDPSNDLPVRRRAVRFWLQRQIVR